MSGYSFKFYIHDIYPYDEPTITAVEDYTGWDAEDGAIAIKFEGKFACQVDLTDFEFSDTESIQDLENIPAYITSGMVICQDPLYQVEHNETDGYSVYDNYDVLAAGAYDSFEEALQVAFELNAEHYKTIDGTALAYLLEDDADYFCNGEFSSARSWSHITFVGTADTEYVSFEIQDQQVIDYIELCHSGDAWFNEYVVYVNDEPLYSFDNEDDAIDKADSLVASGETDYAEVIEIINHKELNGDIDVYDSTVIYTT